MPKKKLSFNPNFAKIEGFQRKTKQGFRKRKCSSSLNLSLEDMLAIEV